MLTSHVANVLDGVKLEEAEKAVMDLKVICRALKVVLVMQLSVLAAYIQRVAVKHTNNPQLRPLRVFVKTYYGLLIKHYNNHAKPVVKQHGKTLYGSGMVVTTWLVFFVLYVNLFNTDFLELSYSGPENEIPLRGPFYKRHVKSKEKALLKEISMKKHRFNSFLSDQTPLNRDISDTRSEG